MHPLPHTAGCFVCGVSNVHGLKLRFETDDRVVRTRFTPGPHHAGFKETVHGGISATVLDEIMVWACAVNTKQFGYCAELTVRFLHPLTPGQETIITGELVANRRNKLFEAKGEIRSTADGTLLATSTGKYLPLKPELSAKFAEDFIGDGFKRFSQPKPT